MEENKIKNKLHIITLLIKTENFIPKVRTKVKIIASNLGLNKYQIVKLATASSEITRYLINNFNSVKVSINFIQFENTNAIQFLYEALEKITSNIRHDYYFDLALLKKFFDYIEINHSHSKEDKTIINCFSYLSDLSWDELVNKEEQIRNKAFGDLDEYYLENLRQKHAEVLRLLKESTNKNIALDRMNQQLLQLTSDMEMLAQERTISELTLKIADKIRNPVTIIGGLASRLVNSSSINDNDKQKLNAILSEAIKLENILKEFDELSKRKTKFFTKEKFNDLVTETLNESLMILNQNIYKKNINVQFNPTSKDSLIIVNKRTFKLAFLHILRNAVHAVPENGTIKVNLTVTDNEQIIEILDNGPGIPDEIFQKLFKEPITTRSTGTGLSLILVKKILQEHQGDIIITTEINKGTNVKMIFPLRWREIDDQELKLS